jgi:hypothetical protein
MKIFGHPASTALGLTTIALAPTMVPFFPPDYTMVYHSSDPVLPLFASVAVDWTFCWFALTCLFALAKHYGQLEVPIWSAVLALIPWMLQKSGALIGFWSMPPGLRLSLFILPGAALIALFLISRVAFRATFTRLCRFVGDMLGVTAVLGVVLLAELAYFAWQARDLNPLFHAKSSPVAQIEARPRTRIVWILLDELSYQQVYERRFPGLALPAFDRLASQSTVFTHVIPAGIFTQYVVPSLLTGLTVDRIHFSADGHLRSLHDAPSDTWHVFDQHQTVFQDAHENGYRNGVAGWFNPYCRILPEVLDQCFWASRTNNFDYLQPEPTIVAQVSNPFRFLFFDGLQPLLAGHPRQPQSPRGMVERHIEDYSDIRKAADAQLEDPSLDFVFLHVPVPHPGGIYDRARMTFTTRGTSYIDNLAIAGQFLAEARMILEQHGEWDSSCVVVMGDHSWRTKQMWASAPGWTSEDQKASNGGQFDDRPAYIVKMPKQDTELRIDTPFKASNTRALLDGVISGQLQTAEELRQWVSQRR